MCVRTKNSSFQAPLYEETEAQSSGLQSIWQDFNSPFAGVVSLRSYCWLRSCARSAFMATLFFFFLLVSFRISCCSTDSAISGNGVVFFSFMLVGRFHVYGFTAEWGYRSGIFISTFSSSKSAGLLKKDALWSCLPSGGHLRPPQVITTQHYLVRYRNINYQHGRLSTTSNWEYRTIVPCTPLKTNNTAL